MLHFWEKNKKRQKSLFAPQNASQVASCCSFLSETHLGVCDPRWAGRRTSYAPLGASQQHHHWDQPRAPHLCPARAVPVSRGCLQGHSARVFGLCVCAPSSPCSLRTKHSLEIGWEQAVFGVVGTPGEPSPRSHLRVLWEKRLLAVVSLSLPPTCSKLSRHRCVCQQLNTKEKAGALPGHAAARHVLAPSSLFR